MKYIVFIAIALAALLYEPLQANAVTQYVTQTKEKEWTLEEVKAWVSHRALELELNTEAVFKIISCESGWKKEIVSRTNDRGLFQINMKAHSGSMVAQGYDSSKWEDLAEYGFQLLRKEGYKPWFNSSSCHGYR